MFKNTRYNNTSLLLNSAEVTEILAQNRSKSAKTRYPGVPRDFDTNENIKDREYYRENLDALKNEIKLVMEEINYIKGDRSSESRNIAFTLQQNLSQLQNQYSELQNEFHTSRLARKIMIDNLRTDYTKTTSHTSTVGNLEAAYKEVAPNYHYSNRQALTERPMPTPRAEPQDNRSSVEKKFDDFTSKIKSTNTIKNLEEIRDAMGDDKKFITLLKELGNSAKYKINSEERAFNMVIKDIKDIHSGYNHKPRFDISEKILKNVDAKMNAQQSRS